MINLVYIATGGAIGAVLRYFVSLIFKYYNPFFPISTIVVNFIGSFLIGFLVSNLLNNGLNTIFIKYFLIIGLLGSFTTFSAFSLETIQLFDDKKYALSLIYILASVILCILGAGLGYYFNKV